MTDPDPNGPEKETAATSRRPLEDLTILAVEQFGAGPFGSLHLAELGAEVIKIEDPHSGGDVSRYVPPYREDEDSLYFESFNRNKRSISLDLTNPAGREVFERLVASSDAVYSNLRGDVPDRLGLTYAHLGSVNPRIVCCSLTAFGMSGPRAKDPGYDYLLQGLCGWMDICGEPEGAPTKTGLSMVDFSGGFVAALAMMAGIHQARRDGVGMDCDVSLFDTALSMLTYLSTWTLNRPYTPQRMTHSAHPSLIPFQNVPTSDGWIVIACAKEKFWVRLCEVLGHPEWATDERFVTFDARDAHREEVVALIESVFVTAPSEEWIERLADAGVPCAPVNTVAEALADPQAEARGLIISTDHPRFGAVRHVASPVKVGNGPGRDGSPPDPVPQRRAPTRGEDGADLLATRCGYDPRDIARLTNAGAFG